MVPKIYSMRYLLDMFEDSKAAMYPMVVMLAKIKTLSCGCFYYIDQDVWFELVCKL